MTDEESQSQRYTDKEYRNFGWARENEILTAGQSEDARSKFAAIVSGNVKGSKNKEGEYMIAVGDISDPS